MEVDNLSLVNLLQSDMGARSEVAGLWQEIRELSRGFRGFKVSFVYREGNEAAHVCARLVSESIPHMSWVDPPPPLFAMSCSVGL